MLVSNRFLLCLFYLHLYFFYFYQLKIEDFGKKLEGLLENKELEKSLEDIGKRLEDMFGSFSG